MEYNDLPEAVKNNILIRYIVGGGMVVAAVVFGVAFKSFMFGSLPWLLAAAWLLYMAVSTTLSIKRDGLLYTEGKLVRMDRVVSNAKVRKLYSKTDAPRAFYLLTENKTEVKIRPDGRKWRYEVGDWLRVYYLASQKPREIDGGLVFFDYLLYEQLTVDNEEDRHAE